MQCFKDFLSEEEQKQVREFVGQMSSNLGEVRDVSQIDVYISHV